MSRRRLRRARGRRSMQKSLYDVSKTTRLFFYLCILFCVSFLVWAAISPLDIVSESVGEVVPSTKVKRIQHLEGGIVRKIKVREGDTVKVGQPLVTLEATARDSSVEELTVRVASLKVEIQRLEAQLLWFGVAADASRVPEDFQDELFKPDQVRLDFSPKLAAEAPTLVEQAREMYQATKNRLVNDINSQKEKIKQRQQDIQEISARVRNQRDSLAYVREQIGISEDLLKDGLTTRYKHLGFLKEESKLKSRIEEDRAALERSKSMLAAAHENLAQIKNSFLEETQDALQNARREMLEFSQRLRKMTDSLSRTVIRSPASGVVKSVYIVNEGEVVQPGITILDIVPLNDKLIIEAHLPISEIGYVQVGQTAYVKLATSDARRFGNLDGRVRNISPDAITTENEGTFYKVLVETDKDRFEREGRFYQLFPGMRVIVGVRTGKRTVMEYLLYPYFDALYEGMHER